MSGYQRVKLWNLKRAWRRAPFTLLKSWRTDQRSPLFFKLHGEPYLLCSFSELNSLLSDEARAELKEPRQAPLPLFEGLSSERWLPLLQRFLSVSLTPLLERSDQRPLAFSRLVEDPLTWAIAHHLFNVDVRKANTPQSEKLQELFMLLERSLSLKHALIKSRGSAPWLHRGARKLYRQIAPVNGLLKHLTQERALCLTYQALEWRRQVTDTLAWLFIYLAESPQVNEQIFSELNEGLESRSYSLDDLSKVPTLHKVILETLRVAPPHWVTSWGDVSKVISASRVAQEGLLLPPHTQLISSPLLDHHEPADWPSPTQFVPHRFLGVTHGATLPNAFLPFGPGKFGDQRLHLALHALIAIAGAILRRGSVRIVHSDEPSIMQRASNGAGLSIERASGASFGRPQLDIAFEINERYIHIPSARI